ncbi:uncharacterized protein FA14DRAFT_181576 [Meira miltonrushii]|uniref:HMG box domain-containing protein n=1 Tax=Meira miltonrushii TaxID=1280837 RepID=A0A316V601_9BASI|nr:uncharacterized protein FA14DRAFT_181576 [Meira miltonrushii]PWN32902.1 hypothetical protein FA14DRAFT_181576 [Meira miltonrushii]
MKSILHILLLLLSFGIANAQWSQPVRRALDPSIDLNRTPSPERSASLNEPQEPALQSTVEDTATTKKPKTAKALRPKSSGKRKLYPTKHQRLRQAYLNRFELHPNDEEKRKSIEEDWQKSVEERRLIHRRSQQRRWQRIRAGNPTEADLRAKNRAQKATDKQGLSPSLDLRVNDDIPDLNVTLSPEDDNDVGNVEDMPSYTPSQSPKNNDDSAKPTKKRRRVEVRSADTKRRKAEYERKRRLAKKYEYENRFSLGKSTEEIAAIENAMTASKAKKKAYRHDYNRRIWSRIKSGQPTAADLILKEKGRQRKAKWDKEHPEESKAQCQRWYYANLEKARMKQRIYRLKKKNANQLQSPSAPSR